MRWGTQQAVLGAKEIYNNINNITNFSQRDNIKLRLLRFQSKSIIKILRVLVKIYKIELTKDLIFLPYASCAVCLTWVALKVPHSLMVFCRKSSMVLPGLATAAGELLKPAVADARLGLSAGSACLLRRTLNAFDAWAQDEQRESSSTCLTYVAENQYFRARSHIRNDCLLTFLIIKHLFIQYILIILILLL